jgi:hypothetical protein
MTAPKFPMAEQAINEITDYLAAFGQKMPVELTNIQLRLIEIIDKTINDNADKDAIITIGVLMMWPEELLLDDTYRFKKDYSPKVQELVIEMLSSEPDGYISSDLARAVIASTVAGFGQVITDIENGRLNPMHKSDLKQLLQDDDPAEDKIAKAVNAPALYQALVDTKAELAKALNNDGPKGPKKPSPKKPGGNLKF